MVRDHSSHDAPPYSDERKFRSILTGGVLGAFVSTQTQNATRNPIAGTIKRFEAKLKGFPLSDLHTMSRGLNSDKPITPQHNDARL